MSFLALLFWLAILTVGVVLAHRKIPADAGFMKSLIIGVLIVAACVFVAQAFGFIDVFHTAVPRVR